MTKLATLPNLGTEVHDSTVRYRDDLTPSCILADLALHIGQDSLLRSSTLLLDRPSPKVLWTSQTPKIMYLKQTSYPLSAAMLALALAPEAFANSPTVIEVGKIMVTPSYSFQTFDEFYAGDQRVGPPPGGEDIERQSFRVYLDYGLAADWAIDLSLGYFRTDSGTAGLFTVGKQDGIADTYFGVRRALARQADQGFDAAIRVGGTLPGDYETGQLSAPGDDAFGADARLFLGRSFGATRLEGALGYSFNEGAVPETIGLGVRVIQTLPGNFYLEGGYRFFDSNGDLDIGGLGFSAARLREVSEQGHVIEGALAYADQGGRYYRVYASQLVDGKNVGYELTLGASVTFPF